MPVHGFLPRAGARGDLGPGSSFLPHPETQAQEWASLASPTVGRVVGLLANYHHNPIYACFGLAKSLEEADQHEGKPRFRVWVEIRKRFSFILAAMNRLLMDMS